jgi:hypothetical protein
MTRFFASAFVLVTACVLASCTDDASSDAVFGIDADENGAVDCADLDHVLACIHHPESALCALADINGDGMIDDADVHDIHHGLEETGHHCDAPDHHDADGHHDTDHAGDHDSDHNQDGHHDTTHQDPVGEHDDGHHTDGHHTDPDYGHA